MWDDELFTIQRLRTSIITEADKVFLLDNYHYGETYAEEVWCLAPLVERKHMVGAERRVSILGVYYQYFPYRTGCYGPARTMTKEGHVACSEAGYLTNCSLPGFDGLINGQRGYSIYPLQFINPLQFISIIKGHRSLRNS